jgi:hypothetical protein
MLGIGAGLIIGKEGPFVHCATGIAALWLVAAEAAASLLARGRSAGGGLGRLGRGSAVGDGGELPQPQQRQQQYQQVAGNRRHSAWRMLHLSSLQLQSFSPQAAPTVVATQSGTVDVVVLQPQQQQQPPGSDLSRPRGQLSGQATTLQQQQQQHLDGGEAEAGAAAGTAAAAAAAAAAAPGAIDSTTAFEQAFSDPPDIPFHHNYQRRRLRLQHDQAAMGAGTGVAAAFAAPVAAAAAAVDQVSSHFSSVLLGQVRAGLG